MVNFFYFFWSFRYWTFNTSQKIWSVTQFEPARWGFLVWLWSIYPWPHFDWINKWDHHLPDSNCVKYQISWLMCISLCPNDQEKFEFDLQAFTRIQNHPIEFDMMRDFSEKGPFLKMVLIFMKSKKVWC